MLPVRLVGKHGFRAYASFGLVVTYIAFFVWEVTLTLRGGMPIEHYLDSLALSSCAIGSEPIGVVVVDSVRALFVSASPVTLFLNIIFLWIFSPLVERFLGWRAFLTLFFIGGFSGFLFSVMLDRTPGCEALFGPNAAIAAIIAAFIFLYPAKRIETAFPAIDRRYDLPGIVYAFLFLAVQFLSEGEGPLSGTFAPVWDEIGGFLVGFVFIFLVTLFRPAPSAAEAEDL